MTPPLIRLATVDSTQSFLNRHPELGWCAVMADHQGAGRGRGGNRWESPAGAGLWLSVRIPRPGIPPGVVLQRAMAAVIAVLSPCGVELGIKWPNDLVARRAGRLVKDRGLVKVGGILGETKGEALMLGLGLNLLDAPVLPGRAMPPSCLKALGASDLPPAIALAPRIAAAWEHLDEAPEPPFRWPEEGMALVWEGGQGTCRGWEADGRLGVETDHGLQRLSVGDVRALADQNR